MTFNQLEMNRIAKDVSNQLDASPEECVLGALWACYSVMRHYHAGGVDERQERFLAYAKAIAIDIEQSTEARN